MATLCDVGHNTTPTKNFERSATPLDRRLGNCQGLHRLALDRHYTVVIQPTSTRYQCALTATRRYVRIDCRITSDAFTAKRDFGSERACQRSDRHRRRRRARTSLVSSPTVTPIPL